VERAAARFGAKIIDKRPFLLSNDPREREKNNVALLTGGRRDYDVVYVADSYGEFGRYVPYQINRPRPVVGTAGLVADWWSWSWERHGAPQLNSRFERHTGRRMVGQDWSAWVGVKAIVQAVTRSKSTHFQAVSDYLRGERIKIDGVKGPSLSFRQWNNQLRQPILIGTHNAIIARAPLRGFLHEINDLDTLGDDARDTTCQF
jgi:ABC transporter substrate binding protein (PQQ-dependent alcohol dehydrogenase system)